jgi:aspartate kinase
MAIRVLKFGGTSMNSSYSRNLAVANVMDARSSGDQIVVVVSAMGRMGEPYATDTLLRLLELGKPVDGLKQDMMASCGEIISATLFSQLLESRGIHSIPLAGFQAGILTDRRFTEAEIVSVNPERILSCVDRGCIPVVAGFQGITRDQEITTLGRGGSDITALVLGAKMNALRVDVFTDVPGVAVADPRVVPGVPYLKQINVEILYELASNGSKVIHPRAVRAAIEGGIRFHIRSTFGQEPGTLVNQNGSAPELHLVGIANRRSSPETTSITVALNPARLEVAAAELASHLKSQGLDSKPSPDKPWLYQVETSSQTAGSAIQGIFSRFYPPAEVASLYDSAFIRINHA